MEYPWIFRREVLSSPLTLERARTELNAALANGVEINDVHRRIFGFASGDRFSLSFGLPLLGGVFPVLRGRMVPQANGTEVHMAVGMRIEQILGSVLFVSMGIVFGGYQIALELGSPGGSGAEHLKAAFDVLPRASVFIIPVLIALWVWRRAAGRAAPELIDVVAVHLEGDDPDASRRMS